MSGGRKSRPVTFLCGNPCFGVCHYSLRRVEESRHRNRKCQRDDEEQDKNGRTFFQSHLASSIQKACEPPPASSKRRRWGRKRAARAARARVLVGERRFPPELPSYLPRRRAARRGARSLPHPGLLNPPTYFLRSIHTQAQSCQKFPPSAPLPR